MVLGKFALSFALNLRKQNVTDFSFIFLMQNSVTFKLLLPDTVSFSTSYQRWLIRQWLLISVPCLCLVPSLIISPTKQPYSNIGNSRLYCYGNSVFTSNFCQKLKNKRWCDHFRDTMEFQINICVRISFKKIECLFFVEIQIQKKKKNE